MLQALDGLLKELEKMPEGLLFEDSEPECPRQALRLLRGFHGLTQKKLALLLGISTSHISEIESGKKMPTLELLNRYAQVFLVPVSSIMFFAENMESCLQGKSVNTEIPGKLLALLTLVSILNFKG